MSATLSRATYRRDGLRIGVVHFGVGNFHRSHQAMYIDRLLELGSASEWAICGVGLLPGDLAMRDALIAQDFRYTLVERDADVIVRAREVASIVDFLYAPDSPEVVIERLACPATRIVTLTITEGGYVEHADGSPSAFSYIVDALLLRRARGIPPFTVVSCDNVEANGRVARRAVVGHASRCDPELGSWINQNVRFPNCMVDRITPATTDENRGLVAREYGVIDRWPVVAEPFAQWVLEDDFADGRPDLERVGVQLVADVVPYERMKLRILNGSHQALCYAGLLSGYRYVHEAIEDPILRRLVSTYASTEAAPTVGEVSGIDLVEYHASVLHRFGNTAIADTLIRIAKDGSDRLSKFVSPVIHERLAIGAGSPLAAFVMAAFATVCANPQLRGAIPDRSAERLNAAVHRLHRDPETFLDDDELFGRLGAAPSLRRDFARAYGDIYSLGVRAAADRVATFIIDTDGSHST
jgi:mannitol 2-dehydrogenase